MAQSVRVKKGSFGADYQLLLPADLVVETRHGQEIERTELLSAEPFRNAHSTRGWPQGAVLRLSLYQFLQSSPATKLNISVGAETTLGMRHNWDGAGLYVKNVEQKLRDGTFFFIANHGWSQSWVTAKLRDKKKALNEWLVFVDLLEAEGVLAALR